MIEYLEIRDKNREIQGIVDGAKSIIWHTVYYGVGDFEIYAQASAKHKSLLKKGYWVTRPNDIEIGLIEKVSISHSLEEGTMLVASGRFAKSILDRRLIYRLSNHQNRATIIRGRVELAARKLVTNNAINCSFDSSRNIPILSLGADAGTTAIIVDEDGNAADKQVSYENLLEYTDGLLQEYSLGSIITLDAETNNLKYSVYSGQDRTIDSNQPIIFSEDYDNLLESEYSYNEAPSKTTMLIGGEGEGLDRFYSIIKGTKSGFDRRETFHDASSISRKYKEEDSEEEKTYTIAQYDKLLKSAGKQELVEMKPEEIYDANINFAGGVWRLNEDYFLGDIVTIQDNALDKYANVRILELTEVQDENGYSISPVFDFE